MKRFLGYLHAAVLGVEALVSIGLVGMAIGAAWELAVELWRAAQNGMALTHADFNMLIGIVLQVFIIVELFRIADAYMRRQNVIPTVLEAALVAVARKFVVFEGTDDYLSHAIGLGVLLLALGVSWFLLQRSNACELRE